MLAGDATVPGLTAAVVVDTAPPAGPDRHRPDASRTPGSASSSTTTARSRASTTSAPAARRSPAAATRSGPMSTSRAAGTPGTSTRAIRARARRSPPPRSRSPSAARTAPRIRIVRRFRDSEIVQHLRLWANSARLEFATDIDWHDRRILLKARFPLAIRADHATFECAHGVIRRADAPQHLLGHRPLRGRRPPLRRPLRARLRRRAPQRRQVRPPRLRQRARPQPAALAGLPRPARRRGPAELHLRALPARRRLADRRRPRRGRGPEPAAARAARSPPAARPAGRAAAVTGLTLGLSGFKPAEDGGRADPARLRAGRRPRHRRRSRSPDGWRLGERGRTCSRTRSGRPDTELPAVRASAAGRSRRAEADGACGSQAAGQEVRRAPGRARRRLRDPRRRVRRPRRPLRLRQEHDPPDDRRPRADDRRRDRHQRPRRQRRPAARPRHRHGLPGLRALPAHDRAAEPRLRPQDARHAAGRRSPRPSPRPPRSCRSSTCSTASRSSSPAASASASPSAAPSPASRRSSSSTSRSRTSTPSSASRCAPRSSACTWRSTRTSVYVTHDQTEAMTLADRIVALRDGRIEQIGTPDDLYLRPANRFVAGFIGSPTMNFLDARLAADDGGVAVVPPAARRCRCPPPSPSATRRTPGATVVFGIRPEDLTNTWTDERHEGAGAVPLDLAVEITEPLGSDKLDLQPHRRGRGHRPRHRRRLARRRLDDAPARPHEPHAPLRPRDRRRTLSKSAFPAPQQSRWCGPQICENLPSRRVARPGDPCRSRPASTT